jgi:hypothetical protein
MQNFLQFRDKKGRTREWKISRRKEGRRRDFDADPIA